MKTFRYKNATIHVRGDVDKERIKNATIQFMTKTYRYKLMKERSVCQKMK